MKRHKSYWISFFAFVTIMTIVIIASIYHISPASNDNSTNAMDETQVQLINIAKAFLHAKNSLYVYGDINEATSNDPLLYPSYSQVLSQEYDDIIGWHVFSQETYDGHKSFDLDLEVKTISMSKTSATLFAYEHLTLYYKKADYDPSTPEYSRERHLLKFIFVRDDNLWILSSYEDLDRPTKNETQDEIYRRMWGDDYDKETSDIENQDLSRDC